MSGRLEGQRACPYSLPPRQPYADDATHIGHIRIISTGFVGEAGGPQEGT